MKIFILATTSLKSTYPLTINKPNAFLKVFNKTLLSYNIDQLTNLTNDISVIIYSKNNELISHKNIPIIKIENENEINEFLKGDDILTIDSSNIYHHSAFKKVNNKFVLIDNYHENIFPIKYAWDLLNFQELNSNLISNSVKGTVEPYATLKGNVSIGEGSIIKNGVYIEGPVIIGKNCTIGPNCYIRGITSIGDNCRIGNAVEIKNSIIGDNVNICHLSYVGDGIIGSNSNLGAGFISSNLRHDMQNIITSLNSEKVNTNRIKLGAIIADGVHTGINCSVYPARKIWPGLSTLPAEIIKYDKTKQ